MIRLLSLLGLSLLFSSVIGAQTLDPRPPPADPTPAQNYLQIYLQITAADELQAGGGDQSEAYEYYTKALTGLRSLQAQHPEWEPALVTYRLKTTEEKFKRLLQENPSFALSRPPSSTVDLDVEALRLRDRFQDLEAIQTNGDSQWIEREYEKCREGWMKIEQTHPVWRPDTVRRQIQACELKIKSLEQLNKGALPKKDRLIDPKLGTPLSV
jgi:hypothetical protein